jgi:hypothetical protein
MAVDQAKLVKSVSGPADGFVASAGEGGDISRAHRQIMIEHGQGSCYSGGMTRYRLGYIFEDVDVFDPAKRVRRKWRRRQFGLLSHWAAVFR